MAEKQNQLSKRLGLKDATVLFFFIVIILLSKNIGSSYKEIVTNYVYATCIKKKKKII